MVTTILIRLFVFAVAFASIPFTTVAEDTLPDEWDGALDLRDSVTFKGDQVEVASSRLTAAGVDPGTFEAPKVTSTRNPVFPDSARRARAQGLVQFECLITTSGNAEACRVSRSVHRDLDRASINAVRRWRFDAARLNGSPSAIVAVFEMRYRLR